MRSEIAENAKEQRKQRKQRCRSSKEAEEGKAKVETGTNGGSKQTGSRARGVKSKK